MKEELIMKKLFVVLFIAAAAGVFAQQKYALVIGNGAYSSGLSRLNNPMNDANDMAAELQRLGFTVDKVLDGNLDQMESAIIRLKNRLSISKNSYGFFFYAGHGVQSGGVNYLIPVGASIPSENSLRERAVSVQFMLGELNDAGNELNIVVLDACRDNPFSWARSGGNRGLTVVSNQPADSIIVYATSAGSTAADGTGRNGLFTEQLLKQLKTPGLDVRELFDNTGAAVSQVSGRKQIPAIYSQYFGKAYLGSRPTATTAVDPKPAPVPSPAPAPVVTPTPAPAPAVTTSAPANMVRVEGGTFQMGSNTNDSEKPIHTVKVKSFSIGNYPVTQKEWFEIMGTNLSNFKGDNLPMEMVSWFDAVEYCNKRSVREGLTPAYSDSGNNITCNWKANGYRLPTEAEWEYAARGGNGSPGNYAYAGSNNVDSVAWYIGNSVGSTKPVGTKAPNSLGLYDMSGNVWEWCWDWYGKYSSGAQNDPRGASSGTYRVYRGGYWNTTAALARSVYRAYSSPRHRGYNIGFRVARNGE